MIHAKRYPIYSSIRTITRKIQLIRLGPKSAWTPPLPRELRTRHDELLMYTGMRYKTIRVELANDDTRSMIPNLFKYSRTSKQDIQLVQLAMISLRVYKTIRVELVESVDPPAQPSI